MASSASLDARSFSIGLGVGCGIAAAFVFRKAQLARRVKSDGFLRVEPPNRGWSPAVKQPPPFAGEKTVAIDPTSPDISSCYGLIISAYVPRPIALVSTVSPSGVRNVAPFSYSGVVSHDPPSIMVSVCQRDGTPKDTAANLLATGEGVVHLISDW